MGAFFGYASLMPHSVTHPARAYTGHMDMTGIVSLSWWMVAPLIALGSLLHFLYDWTGQKRWAAVIGAVNESYWEHIKIAVWPVVLLQVILFALGGYHYPAFIPAATVAIYSLPISMIGIVWLYKSFTKRNILWLDITVFAIVIVLAQFIFIQLLQQLQADRLTIILSIPYLLGIIGAFLRFSLRPPAEPDVFVDPITDEYGIEGHAHHH